MKVKLIVWGRDKKKEPGNPVHSCVIFPDFKEFIIYIMVTSQKQIAYGRSKRANRGTVRYGRGEEVIAVLSAMSSI